MTAADPLIVTLALDGPSFAVFDGARRRHFPPDRNHIPAHLTLFYRLPGTQEPAIAAALAQAAESRPPIPLRVTGLRSLGRGVAYTLASPDLDALRARLAGRWPAWLTPQDRQPFRPHVTIQNKVEPAAAAALLAALGRTFSPFDATGEGLRLWRYRGGPWDAAAFFPFRRTDGAWP